MAITTVYNELIAVNAISGTLIADNAITATHIATNAVSGVIVADNSITTVHIAQNNVTSTSIVANAITSTQLADNAVIANKIPDGTIATAHLADNAVTAAKIPDNVLTATMLPDNVILATHIPNATALNLGTITSTGNLSMATDDATIYIGADLDLRVTHSGTSGTITNNTGDLLLDVAGDIILDADGGDTRFRDGGAGFFTITNSSLDAVLKVEQSNEDLLFKGNDGGSEITALTLDMSEAGKATFNAGVTASANSDVTVTGSDAYFTVSKSGAASVQLIAGGAGNSRVRANSDLIFDANSSEAMRIQGSSGNVGIGVASPDNLLTVKGAAHAGINIRAGDGYNATLAFSDASGVWYESFIRYRTDTNTMAFDVAGGEKMSITSAGKVLIGTAEAATMGKAIVMAMVFG